MSLENSISAFTTQAGLLLDLPQQLVITGQAQIAAVGAAATNRIAIFKSTFYVNGVTGSNANPGTSLLPLATIQKAIDLTPDGGTCIVMLQSAYTHGVNCFVGRRCLIIKSATGAQFDFNPIAYPFGAAPVYRDLYHFRLSPGGAFALDGLTYNVPAVSGDVVGTTASNCGIVALENEGAWGHLDVSIKNCRYRIPATPATRLLPSGGTARLQWYNNVLDGATTSLLGQVINDATSTSGTLVTSRADFISNLTSI